jgi:hypothetical protein
MKHLWRTRFVANFDPGLIDDDKYNGEWKWLKAPIALVMAEKWDLIVDVVTVVKKENLIEIRAYFPSLHGKFESFVFCTECKKQRNHDLDTCRVECVMES